MNASWPQVPLGELLAEQKVRVGVFDADGLPLLGVSNTSGLHRTERPRIADMSRYLRVDHGWFAYNPMRINVGSIGWAERPEQTGVISPDYVVFSCTDHVESKLVYLFLRSTFGLRAINLETAGSVRERLYFDSLARIRFPLAPLPEQRRIVARLEELAAKVNEARKIQTEVEKKQELLLSSAFHRIAANAPRRPLGEIAPLTRRPVPIDPEKKYPQIAVRSFGKGTFHKLPIAGSDVTWQKPFLVKADDILISNIKAWEGAIAVATHGDDGRVGSHRYLTCVPRPSVATARFVCFYLLTPEGLHEVGEASPGSADRNRTLSSRTLLQIPIPVPSFEQQLWFDRLYEEMNAIKTLQAQTAAKLHALLPSILDKAFKGEL